MLEALYFIYLVSQKKREESRKKLPNSVVHLQSWCCHKLHFDQSCDWAAMILASLEISIWEKLHNFIDLTSWSLNIYAHLYSFLAGTLSHGYTVSRDADRAVKKNPCFSIRVLKNRGKKHKSSGPSNDFFCSKCCIKEREASWTRWLEVR